MENPMGITTYNICLAAHPRNHKWLIEGSLEAILPTIWTVEKQR
jgi:hypothetical protein